MGPRTQACFLIILGLLTFPSSKLWAQGTPVSSQSAYIVTESLYTPDEAWQLFQAGNYQTSDSDAPSFAMSFDNEIWIWLHLDQASENHRDRILELDYPRFDSVYFYVIQGKDVKMESVAGDGFPFYDRTYPYRTPVVRLSPIDSVQDILIRARKTGDSSVPLILWEEEDFHSKQEAENLFFGIIFGILLCAVFINMVLFLTLRNKTYIFYFLYTLFLFLFMFTNFGYSQYVLWPNWVTINNEGFFVIAQCTVISFVLFFRYFLSLDTYLPTVSTYWIPGIVYTLVFFCVIIFMVNEVPFIRANNEVLAVINYLMYLVCFLFALVYAVIRSLKGDYNARIFLFCFSIMILGIIINTLRVIAIIPYNLITANALVVGAVIEVVCLTIGIGYQLKRGFEQKNILLQEVNDYQRKMMTAMAAGQETERNRIGRELHDGVGSTLSALKLQFENVLKSDWVDSLDRLIVEIRTLSHSLISPSIAERGMLVEVEQLIDAMRSKEGQKIEFIHHNWDQDMDPEIATVLFRVIQELLNNALKHAQSEVITLQLIGSQEHHTIIVEDDGKGIGVQGRKNGIGFDNIRSRIHHLHGDIQLDTSPEYGTHIQVVVPKLNH